MRLDNSAIDADESSRFVTEGQSKNLIEKLITLPSDTNAGKLKQNLHVPGRVKAEKQKDFLYCGFDQ